MREERERLEEERKKLTDDYSVCNAALTDVGDTMEEHTLLVSLNPKP